jgi:hypothetical protein
MDVLVLMQVSMSYYCLFHLTHLVLMMHVMFVPLTLFANCLTTDELNRNQWYLAVFFGQEPLALCL